jgi:hypothetical protein
MRAAVIDLNLDGIACRAARILDSAFVSAIAQVAAGDARAIYLSIAEMTVSPENLRLGYQTSEALAILMRTPDNTLGAFWHDFRSGPSALFSR